MANPTEATTARRTPLARTRDGEPFAVPPEAYAWRVRRFRNPGARGAPELVYGDDAAPLELPIDTAVIDFRAAVGDARGGYRLDAIDLDGLVIPKLPPAYLQIDGTAEGHRNGAGTPVPAPTADPMIEMMRETMQTMRELARTNAELATRVIERFPAMLDASANLVRAADGAGLPQRAPHDPRNAATVAGAVDEGDDDDDAIDGESWAGTVKSIVDQLVPMVQMMIAHRMGSGAAPRNATSPTSATEAPRPEAPASPSAPTPSAAPASPSTPAPAPQPPARAAAVPPPPTTDQLAHFAAIQVALTPREGQIARALAAELRPDEMASWLRELCALSVPEAVGLIRRHLAQTAPRAAGADPELARPETGQTRRPHSTAGPDADD